jgi:hypothetical protein
MPVAWSWGRLDRSSSCSGGQPLDVSASASSFSYCSGLVSHSIQRQQWCNGAASACSLEASAADSDSVSWVC